MVKKCLNNIVNKLYKERYKKESKMRFIEILNGIDMDWSIKEKARYVYTNLCKNISYDERFSYSQNRRHIL